MRIIENQMIVLVDIDDTLVMWDSPTKPGLNKVEVWYGDEIKYLTPHRPNIDLIKEYKNRGFYLIAHSANGAIHAARAIKALDMESYFEICMTKCAKIVDDRPVEDWIGARVYLPIDYYEKTSTSK